MDRGGPLVGIDGVFMESDMNAMISVIAMVDEVVDLMRETCFFYKPTSVALHCER